MREYNFDGLVGPTHNYGGLAFGNVASDRHRGSPSNPREAALQGLAKMRWVSELGVGQALLPPHPRPSLPTLRSLGFLGSDEEVIAKAATTSEHLLRLCSSAAAMWTANAATVAPSEDTDDGKVHFTPANLQSMFHRALEASTTERLLRAIFHDPSHFVVHPPLPGGGQLADEGAANHTRLLVPGRPAVHVFAWGRSSFRAGNAPSRFPARQTLEASETLARRHAVNPASCLFPQQAPSGIDAGAFHTDVVAVGAGAYLMLHPLAFSDTSGLLLALTERLGPKFKYTLAQEDELPIERAVAAYPFNSQLLELPGGKLVVLAPSEAGEDSHCRRFFERVLEEDNPVSRVEYLDVRQSMKNGGGPACLRLRVWLNDVERTRIRARVFFTPQLDESVSAWIRRHYRDRLVPADLGDPKLWRESMTALDELTQLLELGSVYDFQRTHATFHGQ